jgi:hypothetical protein
VEDEASIALAAQGLAAGGAVDLIVVASGLLHDDRTKPEKSYRHLSGENFQR